MSSFPIHCMCSPFSFYCILHLFLSVDILIFVIYFPFCLPTSVLYHFSYSPASCLFSDLFPAILIRGSGRIIEEDISVVARPISFMDCIIAA